GRLGLLELVLAVVHDLDHGRSRHRRHLDQVQAAFLRCGQRLFHREYPELLAFGGHDSNGRDTDLPVYPDAAFTIKAGQWLIPFVLGQKHDTPPKWAGCPRGAPEPLGAGCYDSQDPVAQCCRLGVGRISRPLGTAAFYRNPGATSRGEGAPCPAMPESGGDLRHAPDPVRGLRGAEHRSVAVQEHQHSVYHQNICPIQIQERREQNLILLLNGSIDWCHCVAPVTTPGVTDRRRVVALTTEVGRVATTL